MSVLFLRTDKLDVDDMFLSSENKSSLYSGAKQ